MAIYQQDTLRTDKLLQPPATEKGSHLLIVKPEGAVIKPIPERDTSIKEDLNVEKQVAQPAPPSAFYLRNRWWQKEKQLLVDGSRYIKPQNKIQLTTEKLPNEKGITLPNRKINTYNSDWLTVILLAALILYASVRTAHSKYMVSLFQSLFNYSTSSRMFEEKNYSFLHAAFRLEVYFYITFSVYIFQVLRYFKVPIPYQNFGLFLYSIGLVLVFFIGKKMAYKAVGIVLEGSAETNEYLFNLDNINRVTGLVLFPIVAIIAFYPSENAAIPVFAGIIFTAFLYFLLLFRGITILMKKQFSIFYLFLYFCTLEILPLVLLYKIVAL